MKLTIDTKEDSHEDIKKVITLLSQVLSNNQSQNNLFDSSQTQPTLMNMFDQPSPSQPPAQLILPPIASAITPQHTSNTQEKKPQVELY